MTSTKNHVWINVHFPKDVHASLKAWCIRNGRSMQDGLVEMVALMSGPNGLRLTQPTAVVPTVLRAPDPPRAAAVPVRVAPAPAVEPEASPPFDPEDCYRRWSLKREHAYAYRKTKEQCDYYGIDWEPGEVPRKKIIDASVVHDSIDANDDADEYADGDTDAEEEAHEPSLDPSDARTH